MRTHSRSGCSTRYRDDLDARSRSEEANVTPCLASGAAPQVVALVAAVPFTASLALFGGTELIGHLPVYGVLLTLLLLGSDARTAPYVRALRPVRRLQDAETRRGQTPAFVLMNERIAGLLTSL